VTLFSLFSNDRTSTRFNVSVSPYTIISILKKVPLIPPHTCVIDDQCSAAYRRAEKERIKSSQYEFWQNKGLETKVCVVA
jgi:hypothetical protein